ncbi:hypothetical protein [Actimicrobium sp. GrIS 1.19]|uniref:hypothetical protein n=1 Tax=Actimicrobium sp. GrIS 1.19 TaxID=3071708 RepID=UPI002E1378F5
MLAANLFPSSHPRTKLADTLLSLVGLDLAAVLTAGFARMGAGLKKNDGNRMIVLL